MKAEEIMTKDVVTIKGSATIADAIALMKQKEIRALIVARRTDEDAYGILTETDIVYKVTAFGTDPKNVRVCDIMTKPCIVVNPELGIEYVARLFANTGIRRAPVIKGELLGIISITDILRKGDFVENPKSSFLQQEIEKAINEARTLSASQTAKREDIAAAWDIVEELQAEASHQQAKKLQKTAFDLYCEENPEAIEARIYDN